MSDWMCGTVRPQLEGCCQLRPGATDVSKKLREDVTAARADVPTNGHAAAPAAPAPPPYKMPTSPSLDDGSWSDTDPRSPGPTSPGPTALVPPTPGKDKVTQVVIKKSSPDLRLGVRLAARKDGGKEGVEVINVHPKGPLAKVIQKGDVLLRINGQVCNSGYQQAAEQLRDACGVVDLVVSRRERDEAPIVHDV